MWKRIQISGHLTSGVLCFLYSSMQSRRVLLQLSTFLLGNMETHLNLWLLNMYLLHFRGEGSFFSCLCSWPGDEDTPYWPSNVDRLQTTAWRDGTTKKEPVKVDCGVGSLVSTPRREAVEGYTASSKEVFFF